MLESAAESEAALPFGYGPPSVVKPSWELLGEALQGLGRHEEAQKAFERSLDQTPGRPLSLLGLARSLEALGDRDGAQSVWRNLAAIWRNADPEANGVREARAASR
jgi:tetratricopeptide (TPR) repeat protein